ncbi:unnamed protein product, partial [Mesorhabditis belari]|uniref:Cytochrome b5 heme-binding domain-containing protein n=1 Tax=Mesorhabditis belari TaxID=2138241 RepID=A0AAF3EAA7_9BILA
MPGNGGVHVRSTLYTTGLIYIACQIAFVSFLSSYYNCGFSNVTFWLLDRLEENDYMREKIDLVRDWVDAAQETTKEKFSRKTRGSVEENSAPITADISSPGLSRSVFTPEQLLLFDGTRASRPVYLAILGRVYDVDKGKKHYGKGGGYSFFAGKDGSRAFVSGDFTPNGLIDDLSGLGHDDLLGIRDWVSFYEKDYTLIGVVTGRYYDAQGNPTDELKDVLARMEVAAQWRAQKAAENEVFPPCNSEWKKESGGRMWCSTKSGGIQRDWVGVPRKYTDPTAKGTRCACVKNFGPGLSVHAAQGANRGDLDHPFLSEYEDCSPTSMSCKILDWN